MARLDIAIVQQIKDNASLASLLAVSGSSPAQYHIYPNIVPDNQLLAGSNFVTYSLVGTRSKADVGFLNDVYQFKCVSKTYANVQTLREQMLVAFQREKGTLGSSSKTRNVFFVNLLDNAVNFDEESKVWICHMQFVFRHQEDDI